MQQACSQNMLFSVRRLSMVTWGGCSFHRWPFVCSSPRACSLEVVTFVLLRQALGTSYQLWAWLSVYLGRQPMRFARFAPTLRLHRRELVKW